ncbi:MAG: Clp protease N-terminal domain-containing protein, partial [Armatimonadota bacterium]
KEGEGLAGRVLQKVGVQLDTLREVVVGVRESLGKPTGSKKPFTPEDRQVQRNEMDAALSERHMLLRRELYRPEFLALLLLSEDEAGEFLQRVGIDVQHLRTQLEIGIAGRASHLAKSPGPDLQGLDTTGIAEVLTFAQQEGGNTFTVPHVLIGIFREGKNAFAKILGDQGITLEDLRKAL